MRLRYREVKSVQQYLDEKHGMERTLFLVRKLEDVHVNGCQLEYDGTTLNTLEQEAKVGDRCSAKRLTEPGPPR